MKVFVVLSFFCFFLCNCTPPEAVKVLNEPDSEPETNRSDNMNDDSGNDTDEDFFIIDEELPSYYSKQYLIDKCAQISNSMLDLKDSTDSFVFITDTHFERNACYSGRLINTIIKNTSVGKVIYGGDTSSEWPVDYKPIGLQLLDDNINKLMGTMVDRIPVRSIYSLRGNHDFSCRIDESSFDGYPISYVKEVYMSFMPKVIMDRTDNDGLYYFFDNDDVKVRYIAVDTSYGNKLGAANIGFRQLKWILEVALNTAPENYSLVFLSHIPISKGVDITTEYLQFTCLRELIGAINNKRKGIVKYDGKELEYDFTSSTNTVLFVLSGHIHCDGQAFEDNVLYITTTCDRVSNDMTSQYEETYKQTRRFGDITEQAFDVVSYSNENDGWVLMTRFGSGYSRYYNKRIISLRKCDTITLDDKLTFVMPVKWDGNDAPGPTGSWSSHGWIRNLSVVGIKGNQITALEEGEAMIFAEDIRHNKEFFLIKVDASI